MNADTKVTAGLLMERRTQVSNASQTPWRRILTRGNATLCCVAILLNTESTNFAACRVRFQCRTLGLNRNDETRRLVAKSRRQTG